MIENQVYSFNCGASVNYLIWQHWYAAAQISEKYSDASQGNRESAIAWLFGAGYNAAEIVTDISKALTLLSLCYARLYGVVLMLIINFYSRLVLTRVTHGL